MLRAGSKITLRVFPVPALVLFLVFVIYPILRSVYYSLFNWKGMGPAVDFLALKIHAQHADRVFMIALKNGMLIALLSLTLQLPFALGLALLIGRDLPGRAIFRMIFFMPYVFSEVIVPLMWLGLPLTRTPNVA